MPVAPSRLQVQLFGPVAVTVDGAPLEVDTKKALALLAYLAVAGREQSRDHLADLLWPDTDPDRARASLRRTLSALRSGLADRWVEADRSTVSFRAATDVEVDVDLVLAAVGDTHGHAFDQVCARCIESLRPAAILVRGEFMEGFALRGCPEYDDWMLAEAEHLRRRVSTLLERLSAALASEGRYAEAIEASGEWLKVDPLHERAHRHMMLLHAWSGDRSGSIDAYRACVALLDRELGVKPLEETTELYEAILEEDLPRAPAPQRRLRSIDAPAAMGYPLVGRSESLARLRAAAERGHGLVIVEGEMGVGKSRLLEELASELRPSGPAVLVGEVHRSESAVAYGPIQAVLSAAFDDANSRARLEGLPQSVLAEVARLLPALGEPSTAEPSDGAARTRFLEAISHAIGAIGDPVVLAIDNVHWLDAATVELVAFLARRLERLGVVLVLTRRPEDTPLDHPISVLVEDLSRIAELVRLERLDRAEVDQLIGAAGVTGLDPTILYDRSKGLPFFVVEYLDAARAGHRELPDAVRRLVKSRLSDLDAIGRQLVTAAAVIGGSADSEAIRTISGRSEDEVASGLEDLIRRSLLRERDDGTIDFVHEQMAEVTYEDTSLNRRRLLHRRAAEHLSSRPRAASDPRLIAAAAGHLRAAGSDNEAAAMSVSAGDLAIGVFAFREAIGHFEDALALGYPDRTRIHRKLGDLRTLTGEYGAALAAYETARATAEVGSFRDVAAITHAIGEVYRRLRRWDVAAASYEEAHAGAGDDSALQSRVASDWAFVEHRRGDGPRASSLVKEALALADQSGDPDAQALASNLAGLLAGETSEGFAYLARALDLARGPSARAAVLNNLALAMAASGDVGGAIGKAREALEQATLSGDRHRIAALHDTLADLLHRFGNEEEAMSELKTAVATFAEIGIEPGSLEPEVWLLKEW